MRLLIVGIAFFINTPLWAQNSPSPDLPGALRIQVGTNILIDEPASMGLGIWGSKSFNAHYLYAVPLGNSPWSFHAGFGLGTDKYSFDDNITLQRVDDMIEIVPLEVAEFGEIKKSKLATTSFEVPLELRFHLNKDDFKKSVKIAVGGKVGVLMNSHTKVKYKLNGENTVFKLQENFELSRFRYGIQGSLGIAGINVYYYYGLNELFKNGKGPEGTTTNQSQMGISFNLF